MNINSEDVRVGVIQCSQFFDQEYFSQINTKYNIFLDYFSDITRFLDQMDKVRQMLQAFIMFPSMEKVPHSFFVME